MVDAQADFEIFRGVHLVQIAAINQRLVLKGPEHVITRNRDILCFMLMLKSNTRLKMTHTFVHAAFSVKSRSVLFSACLSDNIQERSNV